MGGDNQTPLRSSGGDTKSLQTIRQGMDMHVQQGGFWDAFLRVCNNIDGMAELMDIRPDQLSRLTSKVRDLVKRAADNPNGVEKKTIIPTGSGNNQETI